MLASHVIHHSAVVMSILFALLVCCEQMTDVLIIVSIQIGIVWYTPHAETVYFFAKKWEQGEKRF